MPSRTILVPCTEYPRAKGYLPNGKARSDTDRLVQGILQQLALPAIGGASNPHSQALEDRLVV